MLFIVNLLEPNNFIMEKKYSNKDITIVWQPDACIHSTKCWKGSNGLLSVFNPAKKPWIDATGASTEEIIQRIDQCPSGALSYFRNGDEIVHEVKDEQIVEVLANGPLMVYGNLTIKDPAGNTTHRSKVTAFCRCGQSNNKPYCDGSHVKIGFKG